MMYKPFKFVFWLMMSMAVLVSTSQATVPEEEKVVYLTFDDGPTTGVTEEILDVLNKENVKATFFVVGKEIIQREKVLQRIYEEGHTIGLHTYSHNFKKIYASETAFLTEMQQVEDKINEVIGKNLDLKAIRFPGGSSGRLTQNLLVQLHEAGYKIYDWNVNLEDGVNPQLQPWQLLENAKKCSRKTNRKIILAHCNINNKSTPRALADIIQYYRSEGYVFKAINDQTEEFYYRIKEK